MAIGFIGKDFNVFNKIPGWETNSIGYHSDDGNIFISKTNGESYGPTFNSGDTVGCCIDFINKIVFFTKNGEQLKSVYFDSDYELYPSIGMRKNKQSVNANFGSRRFVFDFEKYYNIVMNQIIENILKTDTEIQLEKKSIVSDFSNLGEKVILDYLMYNGYEETYAELNKSTHEVKSEMANDYNQNEKLKERKLIYNYIMNRDFENAIQIIRCNFVNCDLSIHFLIFVEKVNKILHKNINILDSMTNEADKEKEYLVFLNEIRKKIIEAKNSFKSYYDYSISSHPYRNNSHAYTDYDTYFNEIINKTSELFLLNCNDDKICNTSQIKDFILNYLSSDSLFEIVNRNILLSEYLIYRNQLEVIYIQLVLTLKENLKFRNPVVNFLMNNKKFLEKINQKFIKCSSKYV